jgi:hypothetical protein
VASAPTDWGANYLLAAMFGLVAVPTGYWVALITGDPGTDTDGDILVDAEPDDPGTYARIWVPADDTHWTISGQYLTNLLAVNFALPTASWDTPDHYALCTQVSGGEVYAYGELATPQALDIGQAVALPPGGIVLGLVPVDSPIAL